MSSTISGGDNGNVPAVSDHPIRSGVGTSTISSTRLGSLARNAILVAVAIEILVFGLLADGFMTASNLRVVLLQSAVVAMLVVPSAIILMAGYVDLSIGSIVGLSAVAFGQVFTATGSVAAGVVAALAVGLTMGSVNGYLSAFLGFSPIVVTLGTLAAARGLALVITGGKSSSRFGDTFALLGRGQVRFLGVGLEIPLPVLVASAVFVIGGIFLYQTLWGRHVVALGANPTAAFHSGIRIELLPFLLYVITGLIAAVAALTLAARLNSVPPTMGEGLEIDVLTAVLLGGVAFGGGRGTLLGVAGGVLFIAILGNGLVIAGASPFWVRVSSGLALLAAAGLDAVGRAWMNRSTGGTALTGRRLSVGRRT